MLANAREMNESKLSERAFGNRTHISGARSNASVPDRDGLVALADTLGVSLDALVGRSPDPGADPSTTLLGFLHDVNRFGIATWAADAPRDETPTLLEAARAVQVLKQTKPLSDSNGVPLGGWAKWFRDLRVGGGAMPKASRTGTPDALVGKAVDDPLGGHGQLDPTATKPRQKRTR